jgi:nicotinamidase-related amidase
MALRFSCLDRALPQGKESLAHRKALSGAGRLFRIEAEAFRIFSSTLETLLRYLRVRRLIITGIAGNFCVLFTANDAYMRDYELAIPSDCVSSNTAKENTEALQLMKRYLKADTRRSQRISFGKPEQLR